MTKTTENTRYALYQLVDGKKLYLVYAPKFEFAKRGFRNPYSWKFEKNALKYQAECTMRGIVTYIEPVSKYVPKHPYGPRKVVEMTLPATPFMVIQEGNRFVAPLVPVRDSKGRFMKAA